MTLIRIDIPFMRKEIQALREVADEHRRIADEALRDTNHAPSYAGQFGPKVRSSGVEIHGRYMRRNYELLEQAEALERIVNAFEAADQAFHDRMAGIDQILPGLATGEGDGEDGRPWWAPLVIAAAEGWSWYDEHVNPHVYQAMAAIADSLRSIGDPDRNPRMAAFHRSLWDGLASWDDIVKLYGITVGYTVEATREGRWQDAGRGLLGLAEENLGLAYSGLRGVGLLIWGVVTTPIRIVKDVSEFRDAIVERGDGLGRGWDVIFTGTMLAGDVAGTYALARPLGLVERVNRLAPQQLPADVEAGVQLLEQYPASYQGQDFAELIRSRQVPVDVIEGLDVAAGMRTPRGILVSADPNYPGSTAAALYEETYHTLQGAGIGLEIELEAKAAMSQWILEHGIQYNPNRFLSGDIMAYEAGFAQGGVEGGMSALRQWLIMESYPNLSHPIVPGFMHLREFLSDSWIIATGIPHGELSDPVTPGASP